MNKEELKSFSVWQGVYNSFSEAGGDTDAFDSEIWINKQKDRILYSLDKLKSNSYKSKDYPLPLVISMLLSDCESLSVLDFGGGMGLQYLEILGKVPQAENKVEYYVVDGQSSIENKPKEMEQFSNLHFHTSLDDVNRKVDVIHIGSTLQYIENWKELLTSLNEKYKPKYFVFSDLLAGDVPTFVSHQIFYEKKIAHLFINFDEFQSFIIKNLGCNILFKSQFIREILGSESSFPNHGLPNENQIDRPYHIVCSR